MTSLRLVAVSLRIFILLFRAALHHPPPGIEEIFERLENKAFTAEWKYDGERTQIHHKETGEVRFPAAVLLRSHLSL